MKGLILLLRAYRDFVILAALALVVGLGAAVFRWYDSLYFNSIQTWLDYCAGYSERGLFPESCAWPFTADDLRYAAVIAFAAYVVLVIVVLSARALRRQPS